MSKLDQNYTVPESKCLTENGTACPNLFLFLSVYFLVRLVMLLFLTVVNSRKGVWGRHTFQ